MKSETQKALAFDLLLELFQFGDVENLTPVQVVSMIYDEITEAKIELEVNKRLKLHE